MKKVLFMLICMCILLSGCQNSMSEAVITYGSVADINQEAVKLYDSGDFAAALSKYSEAISLNPTDIDAMIGTAQCQIALENYVMADTNLSAAVRVDPTDHRIYDLYIQMGKECDNINYARNAVSLAQAYNITDFLDRVPETPEISCPNGLYDSKFDVEILAPGGSDIFVSESKDSMYTSYKYHKPIAITRGDTSLEAYCVVDGIPSDTVTANYVCDYPPIEVSFVDPLIEQLVRLDLGIESGTITDVDCESITLIEQPESENIHVSSLEDLTLFPNLEELCLNNLENITDFSPLLSCKCLSIVDFSGCNIQDISFVEYLPNLEDCELSDNNITDLSPLVKCKNLYNLYVDGNPVNGLEALEKLDLQGISVTAAYIKDFSVFNNWENLDFLQIYGCGGFDLAPLGDLNKLKYLYLNAREWEHLNGNWSSRQGPISDISFLASLTELEHLHIRGLSDCDQIDVIKTLSKLSDLYIQMFGNSSLPDNIRQELQTALPKCSIR